MTRTTPLLPLLLSAFAAAAAAQGKQDKLPKWKIDPYTKNDPKLLEKAGYVSYGPFRFGNIADDAVSTDKIDETLANVPILWVETKHFRIGSNLPAWTLPQDMETRTKIRGELEELQKVLPGINPKTRTLDPWLRVHLTAMRMEKLYAEVQGLFGVKDEDFPQDPTKPVMREPGVRFMGHGPYLGMKDKYLVLMFEKLGLYQRYLNTFLGRDTKFPQRWHFIESSSLMFAVATDCDGTDLKHDTAMHCALAFNVGQNLLDGFRYYSYDLPVWIREGWSHWLLRRVDPKWNQFDQQEGGVAELKTLWKWEPYVRGLVSSSGKFAPFGEILKWRDFGDITFNDHTAIWSRMDFLMAQGPEKWQKFIFLVKGRVDANWFPDQTDIVGAVRDALKEAYGLTPLNFDDRWAEWVKANYPAQ